MKWKKNKSKIWAISLKRIGSKSNKDNKNIDNTIKTNYNILIIENKKSEVKENKNRIDEEEVKRNYLVKIDKILEKKKVKIK